MDRITLFATTPPALRMRQPLHIQVPERYRAELYRAELEDTRLVFEAYAERHPEVAPALLDRTLIETLAVLLDDYVGPGVVADINAFAKNTFPGQNITLETYRQYAAACLERAADPYRIAADWEVSALSSPNGAWVGLPAFYRRYPMVRYMVDVVTENYQRNIQRCCDRVIEDWPDLQTFFFGGTAMVTLAQIKTTGSDFHKGGGQVLILKFRDAVPTDHFLVYKPTDIERDFRIVGDTAALNAALIAPAPNNLRVVTHKGVTAPTLLNNANGSLGEMLTAHAALGPGYVVPVYRILPVWPGSGLAAVNGEYPIRKSYGYIEHLSNTAADNQFATAPQRQAYYRSFGAQLALCWVFQITDLHQENVIVHARMPYLIDLEMAYTGIMALPTNTNLGAAYDTFDVQSTQRTLSGFGSQALSYATGNLPAETTKNGLYDTTGTLVPPDATDNGNLTTAFTNSVGLIIANFAAYDAWLVAAQNVVTRVLPYGTDVLLAQLRALNDPESVPASVTFPDEIGLRMQSNGNIDVQGWGDAFRNAAVGLGGVLPAADVNLIYNGLAPKFSIWFDPQTSTDFKAGDVPAYYQKMSTPQALGSSGKPLQVNYGLAVQNTTPVNQQPLSNALVTIWGTAAPLLPSSYFTGNVVQIQRNYLQALQLNAANFTTNRLAAAINDIGQW